jgi:hemerythrin-like domain-containing protein
LAPLSREHHAGLVMALRIQRELSDGDEETVRALYADLLEFWAAGLLPHFRAEGECLLARMIRHRDPSDEAIEKLHRDHLCMASLVATMRDRKDPAAWREALRQFGESLRKHIRWEEEVLFQIAEEELSPEELKAVGRELKERLPDQGRR